MHIIICLNNLLSRTLHLHCEHLVQRINKDYIYKNKTTPTNQTDLVSMCWKQVTQRVSHRGYTLRGAGQTDSTVTPQCHRVGVCGVDTGLAVGQFHRHHAGLVVGANPLEGLDVWRVHDRLLETESTQHDLHVTYRLVLLKLPAPLKLTAQQVAALLMGWQSFI